MRYAEFADKFRHVFFDEGVEARKTFSPENFPEKSRRTEVFFDIFHILVFAPLLEFFDISSSNWRIFIKIRAIIHALYFWSYFFLCCFCLEEGNTDFIEYGFIREFFYILFSKSFIISRGSQKSFAHLAPYRICKIVRISFEFLEEFRFIVELTKYWWFGDVFEELKKIGSTAWSFIVSFSTRLRRMDGCCHRKILLLAFYQKVRKNANKNPKFLLVFSHSDCEIIAHYK